ncbi:hypothetical protein JYB87_11555 [Shewanella avicenniae]|uniref:DUF304 domain-containing protein n=1 Tax=Shewanella avicenniae TaxID=2814294 RepID=A0ABX7QLS4_9GAMM|nr:hypothetical protein [Shewanella avicenniae]QSX32402.1 hypothetical protein JYB87_11555 [Shewanella avicenniae]
MNTKHRHASSAATAKLGKILYRPATSPAQLIRQQLPLALWRVLWLLICWLMLLYPVLALLSVAASINTHLALLFFLLLWSLASVALYRNIPQLYSTRWDIVGDKGVMSQRVQSNGRVLQRTLLCFDNAIQYQHHGHHLVIKQGNDSVQFCHAKMGSEAELACTAAFRAAVQFHARLPKQ